MTGRLRPGGWRAARWVTPALVLLWACAIAAIAAPRLLVGVKGTVESLSAGWGRPSLAVMLANWGAGLAAFGFAAVLLASAWLSGRPLAGFLGVGKRDPRRFAALIPLGYGAGSLALLGLLLVRLWFPPVLAGAFLVPAALAAFRGPFRFPQRPRPDAPMIAALILLALLVPRLLAPEAHYDAWTYSLAGPARWLGSHGLAVLFADYRVHFPALAELPFALPLMAGLDQAAGWLSLGVFLSGAGVALALVPVFARGWGLLLLTATATMPVVISAKGDGAAAGYVLLVLGFAMGRGGMLVAAGNNVAGPPALLAAAVAAGFALGTKYSAPVALAWVAAVVFLGGRRIRLSHAAVAAVVALPWFLKSWLLTGDPVHPLLGAGLARLAPGADERTAEAWRAWRFRYGMADRGFGASLAMGFAGESACLLWVLPFILAVPALRWPVAAGLAAYAAWYAVMSGFEPPRLGFPVLAGVMVLSAGRFRGLSQGALMRASLGLVLAVTVASRLLSMHTVGSWNTNPFPYLLGMEDSRGYFRRGMTTYAGLARHLSSVATGRATMLAGDHKTWRLPIPALQMVPFGGMGEPWFRQAVREARLEGDVERGLLKRFRRLNAARVVVNPTGDFRNSAYFHRFEWTRAELSGWARFFSRWMDGEYSTPTCDNRQGMYYVYRLRSRPRAAGGVLRHLPGTEADYYRRAGLAVAHEPREAMRLAILAAESMPPAGYYGARAGIAAWRAGQYAAGVRLLEPAVRAGQVEEGFLVAYGACLLKTGRYGEAVEVLARAGESSPDLAGDAADYGARARFLMVHANLADPARAEREAAEGMAAISGSPFRAQLAYFTGLLRMEWALAKLKQGHPEEAEAGMREAAKLVPGTAELKPERLEAWLEAMSRGVRERTR